MDLKFHLNSRQLSSLFEDVDDEDQFPPMFEDPAELDRMIEEEIGAGNKRGRKRIR